MLTVIENDTLPESLMGRLLPLNTGHKNSPNLQEEWTLRRLIQQSGFTKKNESVIQVTSESAAFPNQESSGPDNVLDNSLKNELLQTIKEDDEKERSQNELRLVHGHLRTSKAIETNATNYNVFARRNTENDWSAMKLGMIDKSLKITKNNSRLTQYIKPSLSRKEESTHRRKRLTEKLPYFYS